MQESTLASIAFNIQNFKKDIQIKLFLLMNNSMHDEFFPRFFIFFETFEKNKKIGRRYGLFAPAALEMEARMHLKIALIPSSSTCY